MNYFPLFHNLQQKRCLVVGGGNIALRRAKALMSGGAIVDVVAPAIHPELMKLQSEQNGCYLAQRFQPEYLTDDYVCVVAATDSAAVNQQVAACASALRIPVNVADNAASGNVIFPAIVDRDPLTIAISNSGNSPVLSKLLKQQIELFVPPAFGQLAELVGRFRSSVNRQIKHPRQRSRFWESVLQGRVAEAMFAGKNGQAEAMLRDAVADADGFKARGEVYLIGAGPGDPDLLTLRAFRLIQQAEVVLYDRLVSPEILALVSDQAEKIYVGKRRANHAVRQQRINQMLIEYASQGKRVARLKGGDPFIFGRGGEEIEVLADRQVAFQVVPGITAANGCASYAGIPLTHRDYAQSVQFVAAQLKDGSVNLDWSSLVANDKTLVFYMGLNNLAIVCSSLIEHGMAEDMPVAVIQSGTTRQQRVLLSNLAMLPDDLQQHQLVSPALFIVGKVVKLAKKLNWFETEFEPLNHDYFDNSYHFVKPVVAAEKL